MKIFKKSMYVLFVLSVTSVFVSSVSFAQSSEDSGKISHTEGPDSRKIIEHNPVGLVDSIYSSTKKNRSEQVQNTEYDRVSSRQNLCESLGDSRFTISKTLCHLKSLSKDYLQYVVYLGLSVATIFIIRNGFQLVTSTDREKQMTTFKKNMMYIVIGVVLLIGFYYIIDLFVSVVNLVAGDN